MNTAQWQPVITALVGALLVLIPAVTIYIKALLERQTATLSTRITAVQAANSAAAQNVVQEVREGHAGIVSEIQQIQGDSST